MRSYILNIRRKTGYLLLAILLLFTTFLDSGPERDKDYFTVARLKYGGGGDWYNDASCIPNLLTELRKRSHTASENRGLMNRK